ncbi:transposase (plasmid) [Hoeflea sp. IMCC20628]|nr:transposase [Hoeflea sp. IMCC20628]
MTQTVRDPLYRRHQFPAEVIAHAVWLYLRFPLSLRMVEDLLAARGIIVSHQTVCLWAEKFGWHFANEIRQRSAGKLADKWYLDEVVINIGGKKHWLWQAVDQDGFVLDVPVQTRRNTKAAKRLMRKLLKGQGQARRVMIIHKFGSYGAAKRDIMPGVEHRSHKGLNNRAENSQPQTSRAGMRPQLGHRDQPHRSSSRHCKRYHQRYQYLRFEQFVL